MPANPESSLNRELHSMPEDSAASLHLGPRSPGGTWLPPPSHKSSAEGNHSLRMPSTSSSDSAPREELNSASQESLRSQCLFPALGPWGRCYLGGVGADCCSKVHLYPHPHCPLSRGTGSPGPTPSPSAPGQGIGPAAPACGLGPSTLARVTVRGRGERKGEQSVTRTAPSPTPPRSFRPPPPRPPHPRHPSGAPEPLRLNLVPYSWGPPEAGSPTAAPRCDGATPPWQAGAGAG